MQPEYGFNVPEPTQSYGFSAAAMPSPIQSMSSGAPAMQSYSSEPTRDPYSPGQFATQLMAEPLVANMAMQYGDALVGTGKQHLEKYVPITALKYYFAVDTDYVFMKLALLFFPFTHKVNKLIK